MVTDSVFISTVASTLAASVVSAIGIATVVAKVLGDRIGDIGRRVSAVENRMNAMEGALRDVGQRLTKLETELGRH